MTAQPASPIRVALIDDHKMIVESVQISLGSHADIDVVGTASDVERGVALVGELRPDVVLLDYQLGSSNALDVIPLLLAAAPTKVVVLTAHPAQRVLMDCLRVGARGYVSKEQSVGEVAAAVRLVHSGMLAVAPELLAAVMSGRAGGPAEPTVLSAREFEVLALVAIGRSNQEIADQLFVSVNTVRNHMAAILAKLGARSRVEATAMFHQGRVTGPDDSASRSSWPPET